MQIQNPKRTIKKEINDVSFRISFFALMNPTPKKSIPLSSFQNGEICIKYNARQNRDLTKRDARFLTEEAKAKILCVLPCRWRLDF